MLLLRKQMQNQKLILLLRKQMQNQKLILLLRKQSKFSKKELMHMLGNCIFLFDGICHKEFFCKT
jgi:hypothetical protein